MTIHSGPFNGLDRAWTAPDFAQYFASFIGDGVFPNPSTGLQVVEGTNMQTIVKSGKGWINGYFAVNDSDYVLQHGLSDGVLKRIDRVVMRLNYVTRQIEVAIKKGAFASIPVPPSLQRDGDAFELALADVLINNGVTQITQANVTDQRLNNAVCGVVQGLINQVDTTTIFNQYQSWYEQMTGQKLNEYDAWFTQHQQDFNDWFTSVQGILSGDVAGNLFLLIQQNQRDIHSLVKQKTNVIVDASEWNLNGEYYQYIISDPDVVSASMVDINVQLESLANAKMLLSACNSFDGGVTIYALTQPLFNIIVDYRITKEVI